eukprot:CAMPEP_0181522608 /NCGR_PEP_ID=MMETSP1110-20121109/67463_1 /TAXON_ID=174948 /ORGANISM="Symbiodinium sp., Strain CCMP421" /LENGTH=285 /DNA_ID=CAMNT_0023653233 /DNA_START=1 /DNA_END=854 /DNA_ORIENTATION=-
MEDDELMLCRAPSDQVEQKLSKPKLKDGFVGIRGDYYGQGPVLHMEDAGEKITSPSALSFGSTREPSCDRPDSRASACSDSFRQSRGRMLLGRTARPEDLQRPPSRGPASRGSTPPGEDLGFQQQDEEVLAILAASRRRRLEGLMVDPVSFFEAQELTRPSTATPRGSAQAQALSPRQALRSEGRNWRGVHRPPSASLLGRAPGHSTQYSCESEAWWKTSFGAHRRRQGDFERHILASQEPGWRSELGHVDCGCGPGEACAHWPSGRPPKAGDLPVLAPEGGQAR